MGLRMYPKGVFWGREEFFLVSFCGVLRFGKCLHACLIELLPNSLLMIVP